MKNPKKIVWKGGENRRNEPNKLIPACILRCRSDRLLEGPDVRTF